MVDPLDEAARPLHRVAQILIWTEHLALVELRRIEQVEVDGQYLAIPPWIARGPSLAVMRQQLLPQRIAVIVERHDAIRHIDVVARKAFGRNDPLRPKALEWRQPQISPRKDMAGAVAEEYAVRQRPSPDGILLDAGLEDVH